MTEPQVWVLIGVFAASIFGMFTIVSTLFVRVIRSEISSLRSDIHVEIAGLGGRIERLEQRVDNMDRDVQALVKHTLGIDRG